MDVRDLYGEVIRVVRSCSDERMSYALIRAARYFCAQTWYLRRQQSFSCVVGQPTYPVIPPPNEACFAIKHAQLQQLSPGNTWVPLRFVYPTFVNPNFNNSQPQAIAFIPYTQAQLFPTTDNTYPVLLELITQPILEGNYIPDELGQEWDQTLGYGALAWLLRQPGNPWLDLQGAKEYDMLFKQDIVRARIKAAYDFTPNNKAWISPGFIRGGGYGGAW